jgi:hypothetical protein
MNKHDDEQIEKRFQELGDSPPSNMATPKKAKPSVLVPNNPRIAVIQPPDKACSYDEWQAVIKANFPDLLFSAELCLSIVSQILITDITNPFALVLVDVPSAGKTITLNFFAEIDQLTYATDKFTPASFVSNAANVKKEKLAEVDLLPRIKNKVLIVRDLATIFSKREEDLNELLGILTRVLDGEGLSTESGVHGDRHYTGEYLLMFLAASTPIRPTVWKTMGSLGSRLFFLNMNSKDKSDDELADQLGTSTYKDKEHLCRDITQRFVQTLWSQHPDGVQWNSGQDDRELKLIIAKCAQLLARLRGVVNVHTERGEGGESYSYTTPVIEKPDRINQLLYNLCRGHAVAAGRTSLTNEDIRYAVELAIDSAPTTRTKLLRELLETGSELSTKEVENLLSCSKPTALKEMQTLKVLGLCRIAEDSRGNVGEPEMRLILSDKFKWFMTDECRIIRLLEPINKENLTLCDEND